jgi:hypothetical protein
VRTTFSAPPRTTTTTAAPVRAVPTGSANRPAAFPWYRVPYLALALLALLAGLDAATLLLGLPAPVSTSRLPQVHGPLMVLGFVGTLIALERAVALRRRPGFAAPALLGTGALLLVTPLPLWVGQSLLVAGAAGLVALYVPLWRRRPDDAVLVQSLGAVLALGATVLWLGGVDVSALLPWLVGFVVLTIGGERLELARIHIGPEQGSRLVVLAGLLIAAVAGTAVWPAVYPVLGLALLALAGWLATKDVARRTIHSTGLPRFTAACLLAGYAWLAVAGALWTVAGGVPSGPGYDVVVHATFLGFTVSMILAHAPVILPAILRRPLPYHPAMLAPAGLLQASLAVRLWLGDGLGWAGAWQVGGLLNIVAILGFLAVAVWASRRWAST